MPGRGWVNKLWEALQWRNFAALRSFFKKGADVNHVFREHKGLTPLAMAVSRSTELVKFILEHGCNVDQEVGDRSGETALFRAIKIRRIKMVKLLMDAGANINHESTSKSRPIYEALRSGQKDIVELLLKHKVELKCTNQHFESPIQVALDLYLYGYKSCTVTRRQSPSSMQDIVRRLVPEVDLSEDFDRYLINLLEVHSPLCTEIIQHVTVNVGFVDKYFRVCLREMTVGALSTSPPPVGSRDLQHAYCTEAFFWFVNEASCFKDLSMQYHRHVKTRQTAIFTLNPQWFLQSKDLMSYLTYSKQFFSNPLDLQTLCCQVVRKQLSNNRMWYRIDQLEIPTLLKNKLKLIK